MKNPPVTVFSILLIAVACAPCQSEGVLRGPRAGEATQTPQIQKPPPTPRPTPPEDTARYVEWLARAGRKVEGQPREAVSLRFGDWGFFELRRSVWRFSDRAALDRSGHFVTGSEEGDWYALLGADKLDAAGALRRVAWLFRACGLDPLSAPSAIPQGVNNRDRIKAPTLTRAGDGAVTFEGWMLFGCYTDPPNAREATRVTITATEGRTKIVTESTRAP
ncbi:MAG TPA: hypothetical protein VF507_06540 [Pyrinomonadaceae bacterium]|jgi:hypothetical protein